jgi:diguanylate cyclase (GGDEF)-like protein
VSPDASEARAPRPALAAGVCLVLLAVGIALSAAATGVTLDLDLPLSPALLAVLLVPAYVFAQRVTVDFELRGNSHGLTLAQLPLALGALLVLPEAHLVAGLTAAAISAGTRRQQPLKALFNISTTGFEIGVVTFAVSLAGSGSAHPSLAIWLALYTGLLVADAGGSLALSGVWRLLRVPLTRHQVLQPLLLGVATSTASTVLAVVTLSAGYTEPASIALVVVLAGLLVLGYRKHRRLLAQQATTHELYDFVRDLGPVDAETDAARPVLEQVRLLLHADRLDLLTRRRDGRWEHLEVGEDRPFTRAPSSAPVAPVTRAPALVERAGIAVMSTPLFGTEGFIGLLTARGRLGAARDFDLGDVQLLENVGSELATALERGHLLADLQRTATTDSLTGLPNLAESARLVDQMLSTGGCVVLAALTVDSFREVNDTLGHVVGDALLLETAERLRRTHPAALIGRIGGGRFVVAMSVVRDELSPQLFGLGLRALVEGEARLGQIGTHVRLSVGVAQGPDDGVDAGTLLRRAETAMSSARRAHGGPVAWAAAYEVEGQRRLAVVTALREAVATGAIGLAFQPKVCVRSGRVTGIEALARWTHPALGQVSPAEFVPLAETSGAIGPLTSTVLLQAATACREWQHQAPGVEVSVNVSAQTVLDPGFVREVATVLSSAGLAAQLLTLELTEGVLVDDPLLAGERLGELRALGVRIAVDDFGTGYSSLTYLKGLPVDEVKIDKGFIASLGTDPADAAVVRAVVDIAHTLGYVVVAEGVEIERQQHELLRLGVDQAQGYLHAVPMPAHAVAGWLRERQLSRST